MSVWSFEKWDRISERWPKTENGELVKPAFFEHIAGSQLDIDMELSLLEAYGIPAMTQYPNDGQFGKIMIGFAGGGIDIFVPETMLEDARNIVSGDIEFVEEEE